MKFVSYLRLSKKKLDDKGQVIYDPYGIASQTKITRDYAAKEGGVVIKEFTEIMSGNVRSRRKRLIILEAIEFAKAHGATLLFAYVDRMARDAEFTAWLQNTGVKFICCDSPYANKTIINVMAAFAEDYSNAISTKIKRALDVRREKGLPLGNNTHKVPGCKITDEARQESIRVRSLLAKKNIRNREGAASALQLHLQGHTLLQIQYILSEKGFKSPNGKEISLTAVKRWLMQNNVNPCDFHLPLHKSLKKRTV